MTVRGPKLEADKNKLQRKLFHWPQAWMFPRIRKEVVESVCLKRKTGVPIACDTIKYKTQQLVKFHITWHHFKASVGWCVRVMQSNGFSLHRRTLLCQKLPAGFEERLVTFQRHVI
jgi:hypothetical protein